jgi:hypothetical protein
MDIKEYPTLKTDGMVNKVQKTNVDDVDSLTYAVYLKKYELDGAVAKQLPDEVQAFTHTALLEQKAKVLADAQAEADAIDLLIADAVNGVK